MDNKIFKKIIGALGYKLYEKNYVKNQRLLDIKSKVNLNYILEILFNQKIINSLIQIGANDGNDFDHLSMFIKKYNTKSLLVEPVLEHYNQLRKNYASNTNVIFENYAISEDNLLKKIYAVKKEFRNLYGAHAKAISSFKINHLLKHNIKKNHIEENLIKTISLKELINKNNFSSFDLLFVDAEGYDGEIILNFFKNKFYSKVLIFEFIHINHLLLTKVIDALITNKYKFFQVNENIVCLDKDINISI